MDPEVLTAKQGPGATWRSLQIAAHVGQFSGDSQLQAAWQTLTAGETHVALFRPSWKRNPFLIFVFRIWSRRMFIWSQWCAWSSCFRRKVATAPSFLVAKPRVPVVKCDYAPGFFKPWSVELTTGQRPELWNDTVCPPTRKSGVAETSSPPEPFGSHPLSVNPALISRRQDMIKVSLIHYLSLSQTPAHNIE